MEGGWWQWIHSTTELLHLNKVDVWLGQLRRKALAVSVWGPELHSQHALRSWMWRHTHDVSELGREGQDGP